MQQKRLPIGYYLKLADNCLTDGINEIQSQYGLDRSEWQVLNSIFEKSPIEKEEIIALVKPLACNELVESILSKFIIKKQIEIKNEMVSLSDDGKDLYHSCFTVQQEFRKKVLNNITDADYQVTISTLEKIIANTSENN